MFDKNVKTLSYSSINRFINEGLEGFLNPVYKRNSSLEKGTIIDKIVFGDEITETILDIEIPKPQIKSLIEELINEKLEFNLENVEQACLKIDVKSKKYDKILSDILSFNDYISYFKDPKGKFLKQNFEIGSGIAENLMKDVEAMNYFCKGKAQFEHIFEYKGFKISIKADYLKIDDEFREITVTDLKSSSFPPKFVDSISKYNYHLQGMIYTMGVEDFMEKHGYGNYTLRPFTWVVVSSIKPDAPLILPLSYKDEIQAKVLLDDALDNLEKALNGGTDTREKDYFF
jgi:hypothetical protein